MMNKLHEIDLSPLEGRNNHLPRMPFGLREAESIVRRLAPALQAHSRWIHRLHLTLISRLAPHADDLAEDAHLRSVLGQWLHGEDNRHFRCRPEYEEALKQQESVHALARQMCHAVANNEPVNPEIYETFADHVEQLGRCLESLVRELWDLLRYTDPLTGIATRFAMLPQLQEEQLRVQRTGLVSCVCMVDLDHFKAVNDTFGHRAGDTVLENVSNFFARSLRRYDQVCRYGGEEFVLMLPNTAPESALSIIDRLRRDLAKLTITLDDGIVTHVTASFGIAEITPDDPIAEVIGRADDAMYRAKQAGRNRVAVWSAVSSN